MTPAQWWTAGVLIATAAALIAWDVWLATNDEPGDTISQVLLRQARRHPVIPFVVGVLMGHLFWPQ